MSEIADSVRLSSRAATTLGIATILFGVLAMAVPLASGLTVAVVVGLMLIAAGISRAVFVFRTRSFGKGAFLFGGLSVVCGVVMLARPLLGLASLTMVLAIYFFVDGLVEIVAGFTVRGQRGWFWLVVGGVASAAFGFMIWRQWPVSGAWAIGILVGLRLVLAGWSLIALGAVGSAIADEADRVEGALSQGGEEAGV